MSKAASSFSQVETAIVHAMEAASEFPGRGDPNAQKVSVGKEAAKISMAGQALMGFDKLKQEMGEQTPHLKGEAEHVVGLLVTSLIRFCAANDINIVQCLGRANQHLKF